MFASWGGHEISALLMACSLPTAYPIVSCSDTRYTAEVIVSFRHKGLERLYRGGSKKGVQAAHVPKLLRILSLLDVAQSPDDLAIPSFRTHHPLKGDLAGHWSIWVNGNWRITFRFIETDVELVDYQDYH
jgi:proteic killer suppression protein